MYNIVPKITIHGNIELVIIINYQFPYVISLDMKKYAKIHPNTLPEISKNLVRFRIFLFMPRELFLLSLEMSGTD